VTLLTLTPTQLPRTGASAPLNLTSLMAAGVVGSNAGVTWANTGREFLAVNVASGGSTASVVIGTTIEGQAVTPISLTLTASAVNIIGPFPTDETTNGQMTVNFGTPANISGVALAQYVGVI
jgi:hypothetical protein